MLGLPRTTVLIASLTLGALLIAVFVNGLVRIVRRAVVRRLALAAETTFRLEVTGPLELHLEGPGRARPPALEFTLEDRAIGTPVSLSPIRLRSRIRGRGKARRSLMALAIEHAGEYRLRVAGLGGLYNPAAWAVVLMRPVRGRMFFTILGIVTGAWLLTYGVLALALGV